MRYLLALFAVLCIILAADSLSAQGKPKGGNKEKGPDTIFYESKTGGVTFDHAKHSSREKGDCKVCHPGLFPMDASAPLNYRTGMHRPAETKKVSCAGCHVAGGKAFASAGSCTKCHVKGS